MKNFFLSFVILMALLGWGQDGFAKAKHHHRIKRRRHHHHTVSSKRHNNKGHLFAGVILGAFRQSEIGTGFAVKDSSDTINSVPDSPIVRANTRYEFAWGLTLGYLSQSGNDNKYSYFRFSNHNSTVATGSPNHVDTSLVPPQWLVVGASSASSNYKYNTNIYQVSFGHWFNTLQDMFSIHPFVGVGGADFDLTQNVSYSNVRGIAVVPGAGNTATVKLTDSLCGGGPLTGIAFIWHFSHHFALVGNASWNLLISSIKHSYSAQLSQAPSANITGQMPAEIINFMRGEVGLAYQFNVESKVEIGYSANNFINAFIKTRLVDDVTPTYSTSSLNAGFQGPFIRFSAEL